MTDPTQPPAPAPEAPTDISDVTFEQLGADLAVKTTPQPRPAEWELAPPSSTPPAAVQDPQLSVEAEASGISDKVLSIPMGRWMRIVRRFDMTQDEILGDFTALLIVAANEQARGETGKDDWDKVEAMNLREIQTYLGIDQGAAGAGDAESKSGDGAGGAGAATAPSPDLSGAGPGPS